MPRISARRKAIERRIIEACKRARGLGYEPRKLYLIEDDMADLVATHPKMREPFKVDGMPVRLAASASRLFCKFGTHVNV